MPEVPKGALCTESISLIFSWGLSLSLSLALQDRCFDVAFHPTKALLASGSEDTTVCLWDAGTGQVSEGRLLISNGQMISSHYIRSGGADNDDEKERNQTIAPFASPDSGDPAASA